MPSTQQPPMVVPHAQVSLKKRLATPSHARHLNTTHKGLSVRETRKTLDMSRTSSSVPKKARTLVPGGSFMAGTARAARGSTVSAFTVIANVMPRCLERKNVRKHPILRTICTRICNGRLGDDNMLFLVVTHPQHVHRVPGCQNYTPPV